MNNDSYIITGYGQSDDRPTVLIRYRCYDQEYDTELFLDSLTGSSEPTADQLTAALGTWLIDEAKPQLAPVVSALSQPVQDLVNQTFEG